MPGQEMRSGDARAMNARRALVAVALVATALTVWLGPSHAQQVKEKEKEKENKWDVTADLGPVTKLAFDTSEGTWMNVDVSPDGKRIVFDLLGDIYAMSIDGSGAVPATRLTSGPAFDMQPRFSPDGRRIAITSDRDGLWNIWTIDPDGKDAKQVSREKRWFVNSPSWSPDGDYIYARRHFVKERSLGAGEIWMYHASAPSDGLQVTERTGWQKDNGEPDVSPDGRYLYYSKDVTPGLTFEYNKDPNGTIYAVMRRDLTTGRERRTVSVQGGSVAPQVSPDGKTLAYVRRVRLKSVLYLRDIESGHDRDLFDGLDKDLQEAWAVHGLYPQYAWMPDGRAIVIWGGGKIWKVDAASGRALPVPFTARVEQTLNDAVRFAQNVGADEFPVRMLRDVQVSPDGKTVVYSALGRLYTKQLPDGRPRRLTSEDRLEFSPSFSRDGRWVVHVTWTDAQQGRVRVVRSDGAEGHDVVTKPGHYTSASFSPDGQRIVFRQIDGDQTRGRYFSSDPGVYVVPTGGGRPLLVRDEGNDPVFDHTGTRIYVTEVRNEKFTLLSVGLPTGDSPLPGRDEIEHVRSENATQYAVSPDGRWVAFEERFKTYIAPFPRTGRPVDIGPTTQSYPVQRISRDAGSYLHWSADSRRVHWALGPELFSRDVADTFAFAAAGAAEAGAAPRTVRSDPEAKGVPIGFTTRSDRPDGAIALVGARVITMSGLTPGPIAGTPGVIENATVLVDGQPRRRRRPDGVGAGACGRQARGRHRQDDRAGVDRRARAPGRGVGRAAGAIELAAGGQPRVRCDNLA